MCRKEILKKPLIRRAVLLVLYVLSVCVSYTAASYAVFRPAPISIVDPLLPLYLGTAVLITLGMLSLFHAYHILWEYAELRESASLFLAMLFSVLLTFLVHRVLSIRIPIPVYVVAWAIEIVLFAGSRLVYHSCRVIFRRINSAEKTKRVLVVGAGSAGMLAIRSMLESSHLLYKPVVLVDDDPNKLHHYVHGIAVAGNRYDIPALIKKYKVDMVLIAIPSASEKERNAIVEIALSGGGCKIMTLPSMNIIFSYGVSVAGFQDVDAATFLNRDEIKLDTESISPMLFDKVVMVTGGGGSIGCELCRQIATFSPKKLIIFDIIENGAYDLQNEIAHTHPHVNTEIVIGSIRDVTRLERVFSTYKPEVIFHAAAHKHVPIMENCPGEAVKNNIFGTLNLVRCADKYQVSRFVMISTDKAVNPTNVMGATKRAAEMIVQQISKTSKTLFSLVRFGNVLGSNGSVVPFFKKQIAYGGPVTVTDPRITRFFMTIPEAAQLVIQAGSLAKGGEIFLLDMGSPVKIDDLARQMIRAAGFEPDKDIAIQYTGLRPGEKLYEELLLKEEGVCGTEHQKIFTVPPMEIASDFQTRMETLIQYIDTDNRKLVAALEDLIGKKLQPKED